MTSVERFIEEMKYIERDSDDPNLEYIMELARAIQSDLENIEDSRWRW